MANFKDILNHVVGAVFILLIFSLAYAYLKPHRFHKTRAVSTLLLKGSYLLYLMVMLVMVYFAVLSKEGGLTEVFYGIEFFAFLVVLFGPSIGVFARKLAPFNSRRDNYNYFFTVVNFLCIIALVLMFFI